MKNWKNNRPNGWDAPKLIPEFYDIKVLRDGEWVDEKLHSLDSTSEIFAFEVGADAMLEAIWKLAKESPTGTFTFDTNTINIFEGNSEDKTTKG